MKESYFLKGRSNSLKQTRYLTYAEKLKTQKLQNKPLPHRTVSLLNVLPALRVGTLFVLSKNNPKLLDYFVISGLSFKHTISWDGYRRIRRFSNIAITAVNVSTGVSARYDESNNPLIKAFGSPDQVGNIGKNKIPPSTLYNARLDLGIIPEKLSKEEERRFLLRLRPKNYKTVITNNAILWICSSGNNM